MQLPESLQQALDQLLQTASSTHLRQARETLTQNYKEGLSTSYATEAAQFAYLVSRLPATYAAVHRVLQQLPPSSPTRFLDLGAGPGTASWAAYDLFPTLTSFTLIEKSHQAIALGQKLSQSIFPNASWIAQSLTESFSIPTADIAVLSYVLNEISNPATLIERLWNGPIQTLILIEPGTPKGFATIRSLRSLLISLKAHIIAPCPHAQACPMQGTDWCHFSARVQRTSLHRQIKQGTLGHEDEKFSYLIVSKSPASPFSRILRPPQKNSGHVHLSLCTTQGLQKTTITRSNKDSYRRARDAEWGDPWM